MKKGNSLLILTSLLIATTMTLATWWSYLLYSFGDKIEKMSVRLPELGIKPNLIKMLKWETSTFIILILLLSVSFLVVYLKDQKKTKALQDFFASLTHELKTPLASIRLQSEVITDLVETVEHKQLTTLTSRLIEDTTNLEVQMDKILQLSRLERGGTLSPVAVELEGIIKRVHKDLGYDQKVEIDSFYDQEVLADEFALELIIKNLFENTKNHSLTNNIKVSIKESSDSNYVDLSYCDGGVFTGDIKKLGNLFYKYNSKKGSGIGLYLIKKFMPLMQGRANFIVQDTLLTKLTFKKVNQ
ncbi:hypothetical protein A9Q84_06745 [Halobacteriovorax marinus]|uniref:histidine kinase n=1 Tax=Halobacteriovorax marinus TaxID=97084 RepID=A0A1Y5F9M6_9BACT|nr:hypothetical protein A9Q84_06745 [Halobacteriovorax marinus]